MRTKFVIPFLILGLFSPKVVYSQATALKVIPEVQAFTAATGVYSMPSSVQISVNTAKNDSLMAVATQLKDELLQMFHVNAVVSATSALKATAANEILLTYSDVQLKNSEAYNLELSSTAGVNIKGASRKGAFWGTRTLLQLVENHKNSIPCGNITDYPNFPSRGFMLDVGRKFFTIEFLRDYVKILSYYKMSEFHIHLSDNGFKGDYGNDWSKTYAAFRLESTTYPGLTAKDGSYTKEEFRNLQLLGMQYGVNVIPEIDIPAHALAFTRYNPTLKASAPYADDHLDILNDTKLPVIYEFFDKLFDEYIKGENPTFVGPDVHIGTDEFIKEGDGRNVDNAQAKRFREFTNHYLQYVAASGKNPRLWGGLKWLKDNPITPVLPPAGSFTVMNAWSPDWVDAVPMLADGFKIITTYDQALYIVPSAGYYRDFLDIPWMYGNFRPEKVTYSQTLPDFQKGLLGSCFAVWNDKCGNGISQQDVHYRTISAVKVLSTKNWKVTPARTFADYNALAQLPADAPGVNLTGAYTDAKLAEITAKIGETAKTFDGTTEVELGGSDLGYNYDMSFDLKPAAANAKDAVLFQSFYSKVTLNTNGTNRIGFYRDGYRYLFSSYIPKNDTWQNIRITGDYKSVTLYVDGVLVQKLTETSRDGFGKFQQTLFFPLEKAGDKVNGFKGEMKNLQLTYIDPAKAKELFLTTKTTLEDGLYYIKRDNLFLTNTPAKGNPPTFQAKAADATTQQFKITLDKTASRYKIVSGKDETKYINELGVFGTNSYYPAWNTYNFYLKNDLYAIQNDGDAGKGFWYASNNRFNKGDETYNDDNYIVALEKITTDVKKIPENLVHISVNDSNLKIMGVEINTVSLIASNGKLVYNVQKRNTIKLKPNWKGVYLVKIMDSLNRTGVYKVVL